jgi:type IV secretion system protein VirB6
MDSNALGMAGSLLDWLNFQASSLPSMVFFSEINDFLDDEIAEFAGNLLGRVARVVGSAALSVMTLWILYQGYRIVTGRSREPMMALVASSLRAILIVGIAIGAAAGSGSTYRVMTNGLNEVVRATMTGHDDEGSYADVDKTLAILQVALEVIDGVDTGNDVITDKDKDRALTLTGVGLGAPAIMAATALLLNKIAMALIIGLGPIFILCLLFDQTRQLFHKWLYFGIGTIFSMAFLTVMVTLALDMVIAVGMAFWLPSVWLSSDTESLTSMAMQQGGMGAILTMLIISAPPMAAVFFNGMMGQFSSYNAMSGQASPPGSGIPPSQSGYSYRARSPDPGHSIDPPKPVRPPQATVPRTQYSAVAPLDEIKSAPR